MLRCLLRRVVFVRVRICVVFPAKLLRLWAGSSPHQNRKPSMMHDWYVNPGIVITRGTNISEVRTKKSTLSPRCCLLEAVGQWKSTKFIIFWASVDGLARTEKARRKTYYRVVLGACGARLFRFVACFWWLLLCRSQTITKQETPNQTKTSIIQRNQYRTSSINIITAALHQQLHSDWNSISTILSSYSLEPNQRWDYLSLLFSPSRQQLYGRLFLRHLLFLHRILWLRHLSLSRRSMEVRAAIFGALFRNEVKSAMHIRRVPQDAWACRTLCRTSKRWRPQKWNTNWNRTGLTPTRWSTSMNMKRRCVRHGIITSKPWTMWWRAPDRKKRNNSNRKRKHGRSIIVEDGITMKRFIRVTSI